jgi:sulfite exporter TauE/SafE
MTESLPLLGAAFVTGLLGSAHCFGMCGGISGLFAVNASAASLRRDLPMAITYNVGRVLSYIVLGAAVALLGQSLVDAIPRLTAPVRLLSGLLIVLVGLQLAFNWRALAPIEKAGASLWRRIAPAAKGLLPVTSAPKAFGLGLLWGWLPCGLVYSVLLLAATTANAVTGGLVMLAFGLGTMPAMIATGLSASKLSATMSRHRRGAGLLIILIGLATLAMPVMKLATTAGGGQHGHQHMSQPHTPTSL